MYFYHKRIKFIKDLLLCGSKHRTPQLLKELIGNWDFRLFSQLQTLSSNIHESTMPINHSAMLWNLPMIFLLYVHAANVYCHIVTQTKLFICTWTCCLKLFANIAFTKGNITFYFFPLVRDVLWGDFCSDYFYFACIFFTEWRKSVLWIEVLVSIFARPGRHECHFPFSNSLFFLCFLFLWCFDWSFCTFAHPQAVFILKLTWNCCCDAFR